MKMNPDTELVFWMMMQELESACGEKRDPGRQNIVENAYRHWNATHKKQVYPCWMKGENNERR